MQRSPEDSVWILYEDVKKIGAVRAVRSVHVYVYGEITGKNFLFNDYARTWPGSNPWDETVTRNTIQPIDNKKHIFIGRKRN